MQNDSSETGSGGKTGVTVDDVEFTPPVPKAFLCEYLPMNGDELRAALDNGKLIEKPGTKRTAKQIQLDPTCLVGTPLEKESDRLRLLNEWTRRKRKPRSPQ